MRLRKLATIVGATLCVLAIAYLLAGFLLVGGWVKRQAPSLLAATGHQLRLGDLAFNPITLTARGTDIAIDDANGKPVFSAGLIEVDLEWRSLLQRAIVLSAAKIEKPVLHAVIDEQGQLNLAALSRDDDKPSSGLPRFYLGNLEIADGAIAFSDLREPYANRFEQLSLKLSALSTLDAKEGSYTLTARTTDGAKLEWQGEMSLQPLALTGKLAVSDISLPALSPYLDTQLAAPVAAGRANLQLPHRFFVKDGKPQLLVEDASAEITDLALQGPVQALAGDNKSAATPPSIKLARLAIQGVKLDLLGRQLGAQTLRLEGLAATMQRAPDGTLDITRLIRAPAKTAASSEKTPQAPQAQAQGETPSPPWRVNVARAELASGGLAFTDAASGIATALENLEGHVDDLALDSKELAFEIAGNVRGGGKLSSRGRVLLQEGGFKGRIEAAGIPVALLQPLLAKNYRLRLAAGEATLAGDVEVGGKNAKFSYVGSAAINNVAVHESAGEKAGEKATASSRLLAWKALATDKLSLSLSPDRVSMDELRIIAPVGRLVIAADRSINLRRAFSADNVDADAEKPTPLKVEAPATVAAAPEKTANAADAGGFAVSIRRVRVSDGMLDFSDQTLAQGFNIAIEELGGVFNGLSSDRSTRSQFSLEGKVGEFGYAKLSGGLNPFEWRDRTTMRVEFRNLDLSKVSPYSMKFAGYRIASGRLSLDLRYRINNNVIEGDNQAVFEQLMLGEKVQSPDAFDLPIELAVSLLKDDQGRIDIAIPVSGSLDDPQFDYGTLIRKAIGNVISRIITAPFRALASLFGGSKEGEDIGAITFEPGQSRLLPPEREKIQRIAQGLGKRPEIRVTVPGRADSEVDGSRLKREALAREISRRAGFEVSDDESAGGISIEDSRTRAAIRDLYAERLTPAELDKQRAQAEAAASEGKAEKPAVLDRLRNLATGEPQVTNPRPFYNGLMRRLRETQTLPPTALDQLAQARAQSIALGLRDAGVAENRIGTSVAAPTADAKAKDVKVELALEKK
jgi:uncharacterized protein involved in outer membrane biogenesis/outer membrane protein OmpA-like peptidoglycan-associated protein